MKRFTFVRHSPAGRSQDVSPTAEANREGGQSKSVLTSPLELPSPSPPQLVSMSRQDAKKYLCKALLQARAVGTWEASVLSVVEVVTHASKFESVKQIIIKAGVSETLLFFLKQVIVHADVERVQHILKATLQLLRPDHTSLSAGNIEEDFAVSCLRGGLCTYLAALIEIRRFADSRAVIWAVCDVIKQLLRTGLKVQKAVLGSGIIRVITNQILSFTSHVDNVILLSRSLKDMMSYSSGYRRDHSAAIRDAVSTMGKHGHNIHVARIVCILLAQRKWNLADRTYYQESLESVVRLVVKCMQQWRRDECVARSALQVLRNALSIAIEWGELKAVTHAMLSSQICEICMELLYFYRKKSTTMIDIINFVSVLDSALTSRWGESVCSILPWGPNIKPALIITAKMRINEISMDYRWRERKGFCCFLVQHGCVPHERSHPDTAATDSSGDDSTISKGNKPTCVNDAVNTTLVPKLPCLMNEVFSSRDICVCISSYI